MNRLVPGLFRLKKWLFNKKISRKIIMIFLLFVILSIIMTYVLYSYVSESYTTYRMENLTEQTLVSVKSNIVEIVNTVNNNYNLLIKIGIEGVLKNTMTPQTQRIYDNVLFTIVDTYKNLDAIYITDFDNFIYGVDKAGSKKLAISSLSQAPWYNEALKAGGSYVLSYNAGNIFKKENSSNFISIIRVANDLTTQKPIGFVLLNLPVDSINSLFKTVYPSDDNYVTLFDSQNQLISGTNESTFDFNSEKILKIINANTPYYSEINKSTLKAGLFIPEYNWKLFIDLPITEKSDMSGSLITISVLVLLVNALLMFLCSIFISRSISNPINRLIHAMQGIKNSEFKPVEINFQNSEIGILQENYNIMIYEIQSLIDRLMTEQKIKRKAELSALQEQIKPHFLYNTLDAIGYMALTEDPQIVYDAIETLGSFYRGSLSSGSQVISIKQEIQIVKDYVSLLTLRYGALFNITYDIDEEALPYNVVKLIIQPLIENSVYHGIKPMGGAGQINFTVKKLENSISFIVEDNGIGMDSQTISSITSTKEQRTDGGFGLVGTMERIKIFYGNLSSFTIESHINKGTKITIIIPLEVQVDS